MESPNHKTKAFSSVAIKSVTILIINKVFAIYFGVSGIALLAHFQNLLNIMIHLSNEGVHRGISSIIHHKEMAMSKKQEYISIGFFFSIIILLVISAIIFIFDDFFLQYIPVKMNRNLFFLIIAITVIIFLLNLFFVSQILSKKKLNYYNFINLSGAILLITASLIGAQQQLIDIALVAYGIGHAINFLIIIYFVLKSKVLLPLRLKFSHKKIKKFYRFLLMAVSVLVFTKIVDFMIRDYAIDQFGLHLTGLWQSVVKLSDVYMALFLATVGATYYPRVSSLIFNSDQLRTYLKGILAIILPVTFVGLLLIFVFRGVILRILFSSEFVEAKYLIKYQLLGDFFSIISYVLTYIISAQARMGLFIMLQAGSAVFYMILVYFLTERYAAEGFPMAHAIRFAFFFIVLLILNRRMLF